MSRHRAFMHRSKVKKYGLGSKSSRTIVPYIPRFKGRVIPGYTRREGNYGRYSRPNGELKFWDVNKGITATSVTGTIFNNSLNLIPQGVTESNRVGRKCVIKGLYMKMILRQPATVTASNCSDATRMVIYLDKQCNGTAAIVANLLNGTDILNFRNLTNSGRFRFLCDKTWQTSSQSGNGSSTGEYALYRSINIPNLNIPIEFDSTTGALTEIRSNNIGVMVISESAETVVQYGVRLRFSDG